MNRKVSAVLVAILVGFGAAAYYRMTLGVISPDEMYLEALGQTRSKIEDEVGKPSSFNDLGNGHALAVWQGKDPSGWIFQIWYWKDVAVYISMPNNLVALCLEEVMLRAGVDEDWQPGEIATEMNTYSAILSADHSRVVYETEFSFVVANDDSIFWEVKAN